MEKFFEKIFEWFDEPVNIEWLRQNMVNIILILIAIGILIWFMWFLKSKRRRKHIRFHLHHLSYSLGFRKVMSKRWISMSHVHECFDPLVDFLPHKKIIFNEGTIEQPNMVRKKVLFKLYRLADNLPKGVNLLVLNTFRSKAKLNEEMENVIKDLKAENPDIGRHEALKLARLRVPDTRNMGGHETGGAVDVALCNDKGEMFDYGTKFHEHNELTFTRSRKLTRKQRANRRKLVRLMKKYGFVNFPAEWWHFSYGDRMWAAYKGLRNGAIYGAAETDLEGTYNFTIPVNRSVHTQRKN